MMPNGEILVWSEKVQLACELLGKARQVAQSLGWSVAVMQSGPGSDVDWGQAGADVIYESAASLNNHPDACAEALTALIRQSQPAVVLVGATKLGLEVAPRVAERTQSGYAAWMVDFEVDGPSGGVAARCMMYSGTGMATYRFKAQTAILSTATGIFEPQPTPGKTARQVTLPALTGASQLTILENHPKPASGTRLEDANLVIDVGQGVKQREDLEMIQSLAGLLDGQIGCSRPVASDRDWFPEWLGLSGQKVSPELCITLGVSGAIQHIVGIRDSRLILAVNSDEGAPIFGQSDYGVVADLYAFIPVLMERIKARCVHPAWKS
jgi:electron transfer flavoprotein alpha subunit